MGVSGIIAESAYANGSFFQPSVYQIKPPATLPYKIRSPNTCHSWLSLKSELCIIAQTNPWLMIWSVPGHGGFEGKFGEISEQMMCSTSQLVNTPSTYWGRDIDSWQSFVSKKKVNAENATLSWLRWETCAPVTISIRLWHVQSWRRNYKKFTSTKCTNIKNIITTVFFWANYRFVESF